MSNSWLTDTIPSLPNPPPRPIVVSLGGFVFTTGGIAHNVTSVDKEEIIAAINKPFNSIMSSRPNGG
jgi:hypothetical protein